MNEGDVIGGEAPWEAHAWIRRPWIRGEVECISGGKLAHDLNKPFLGCQSNAGDTPDA